MRPDEPSPLLVSHSTAPIGRGLRRDFVAYAGRRLWVILVLTVMNALVDGFGILMLVPLLGVILSETDSTAAAYLDAFFGSIGVLDTTAQLLIILVLFTALLGLRFLVNYQRELMMSRLELGFIVHVRRHIFQLIAAQPWQHAAGLEQSRLLHLLSRDLDRSSASSTMILRLFSIGVTFTVQLVIAVALAPLVTLGIVVMGTVVFALLRPIRLRAKRLGQLLSRNDHLLFSSVTEFLRGLKSAKVHGLETPYLDRLGAQAEGYAGQQHLARRDHLIAGTLIQTAAALIAVTSVVIGHLWLEAEATHLIVVLIVLARLSTPLQVAQSIIQSSLHGQTVYDGAIAEIESLRTTQTGAAPPGEPLSAPPGFLVENVGWSPPGGTEPILSGVDAEVPAGQITAIAGPSGVGKSTLCDLLAGLLTPDRGRLSLDGAPFDATLRRRLQSSLAYVGQDGTLLQPTVRTLLMWGTSPETTDAEIWDALERVVIADQIRAELDGLDAPLRGEASRFSGGERQRLRLARALLRKPKLLVLDEATNALDPTAEHDVLNAVFDARAGATVIMVSHREETLALADNVIRLQPPVTQRGVSVDPGEG